MLRLVRSKRELPVAVAANRFLAVNMFVYSVRRAAGNTGENLGGTSRRSKQHGFDAYPHEACDDC